MDDRLRISDAERDRAAAELGEHYAQGRITTEEHAERLDRIWAARTRGKLAPVFADLPGHQGPGAAAPARRPAYRAPGPPWRRSLPAPVLGLFVVLLALTIATHKPVLVVGLLVLVVLARRRSRGRRWSGRQE